MAENKRCIHNGVHHEHRYEIKTLQLYQLLARIWHCTGERLRVSNLVQGLQWLPVLHFYNGSIN